MLLERLVNTASTLDIGDHRIISRLESGQHVQDGTELIVRYHDDSALLGVREQNIALFVCASAYPDCQTQ